MCVFFFFKQKTAYDMRISDWSSDVCSSDLGIGLPAANMLERLGCNRIAQMSGNAEMRCPLPRFDPRCHQIDRIGGSMRRKCGEIIGLRQTFEISAGRKDDRHLAAIGHGEGRLRARPENMAVLGGMGRA